MNVNIVNFVLSVSTLDIPKFFNSKNILCKNK